jgi:hypothetical protein
VLLACAEGEQHTLGLEALFAALVEHRVDVRLLGTSVPDQVLLTAVGTSATGSRHHHRPRTSSGMPSSPKSDAAPSNRDDVRIAQAIGLPGVHNAPCRSVSASTHESRVLTQARGAEPYRGMLRVGAQCCLCWEHRPGGGIFSAGPPLACRCSLADVYSAIAFATRAVALRRPAAPPT